MFHSLRSLRSSASSGSLGSPGSSNTSKASSIRSASTEDLDFSKAYSSRSGRVAYTSSTVSAPVFTPAPALPQSRSSRRFILTEFSPTDSIFSVSSRGSRGSIDSTSTDATECFEEDIADALNSHCDPTKRPVTPKHHSITVAGYLSKPLPPLPALDREDMKELVLSEDDEACFMANLAFDPDVVVPGLNIARNPQDSPETQSLLVRTKSNSSADTQETLQDTELDDDGTAVTRCQGEACTSVRHHEGCAFEATCHDELHCPPSRKTMHIGMKITSSPLANSETSSMYSTSSYSSVDEAIDGLEEMSAYEADDDMCPSYHSRLRAINDDGDIDSSSDSDSDDMDFDPLDESDVHPLLRRYRPSWTSYADIEMMPTIMEADEDRADAKEKEAWWKLETENLGLLRLRMEMRRPRIRALPSLERMRNDKNEAWKKNWAAWQAWSERGATDEEVDMVDPRRGDGDGLESPNWRVLV